MKKATAQELLESDNPLEFAMSLGGEEPYDGCCPCAQIVGEQFRVEIHCWRSMCEHDCQYSGIHVTGELDSHTKCAIANHVLEQNPFKDHTDWNLTVT